MPEHEKQPDFLIDLARKNRQNLSLPEKLLWKRFKDSANKELQIKRQVPVLGKYILDFFYEDLQLAIEVDGSDTYTMKAEEDQIRQQEIEATGIAFLRISARYVLREPDNAAAFILSVCRGELLLEELDDSFL